MQLTFGLLSCLLCGGSMKLYWGRYGETELLGEFSTEEEIYERITEFLDELQFKSYYSRQWYEEDGTLVIDYGSWRNLFFIKGE